MPLQKTTVKEIIKSSIKVFREKGYYRTSINDLAKETGLTKGVFYHHFTNKEDIMKTALTTLSSYFEKRVFALAHDNTQPPEKRLDEITDAYLAAVTMDSGGCFFANTILETAQNEDTFLEHIKVFFDNWRKAMVAIFQNKYGEDKSQRIAEEIIVDIEGALILTQLNKDFTILERALKRSKDRY